MYKMPWHRIIILNSQISFLGIYFKQTMRCTKVLMDRAILHYSIIKKAKDK